MSELRLWRCVFFFSRGSGWKQTLLKQKQQLFYHRFTSHLVAPVYTCTSFLQSIQRREASFSSRSFYLCIYLFIFFALPGCVKRARLHQNTFSELVLMPPIGPEVSALKPPSSLHTSHSNWPWCGHCLYSSQPWRGSVAATPTHIHFTRWTCFTV